MQKSKIETFIGFAIRKRKAKCGVNAIKTIKHKVKVLILCSTASKNTLEDAIKLSHSLSAELIISKTHLVENLVFKENCKLVAIDDESLGEAILDNLNEDFTKYFGGNGN